MAEGSERTTEEEIVIPTSRLPGVVVGVILLIIGIYMTAESFSFPDAIGRSDPGPAFIPLLIGIGLTVGSLVHLWQRPAPDSPNEAYPDRSALLRITAVVTLIVLYAVVLRELGFIATTIVFLAAALYLAHARRLLILLIVPVVTSVGLYLTFTELLNVSMPRGLLEGIF